MVFTTALVNAQGNIENKIRALDKAEAEAVLKHDTTALENIWGDNVTVNTPYNGIGTKKRATE